MSLNLQWKIQISPFLLFSGTRTVDLRCSVKLNMAAFTGLCNKKNNHNHENSAIFKNEKST